MVVLQIDQDEDVALPPTQCVQAIILGAMALIVTAHGIKQVLNQAAGGARQATLLLWRHKRA